MVCGTSSGAGKSFLATALARWYARQGLAVAPFKAQNMSNNARVVQGGEIGSAQYFQALAARCVPDVRMNPVLLKPERDDHSQVIVLGQRRDDLAAMEWRARAVHLWPIIHGALEELLAQYDLVVIEGAGSPAEINLQSTDVVNMRVAEAAGAATLIVSDVDRGGAFAHLYGTFQLLPAAHRALIRGFILNKFRGNASLLAPGPQQLQALTGVPMVGVLPMWREHGLPEEDGVFVARVPAAGGHGATAGGGVTVAIVAYPHLSNLDEFAPLERVPGVRLRWVREASELAAADLVVLPGSKHVAGDLEWLRQCGLDAVIAAHRSADKPLLAVCGGLQMLGGVIGDPHGVEAPAMGLGLLPFTTEFQAVKRQRRGSYALGSLTGYWGPLSGVEFSGYEIRHGTTRSGREDGLRAVLADDGGWQQGQTLALYVHGLFETAQVVSRLFGHVVPDMEETLDGLAGFADAHFEAGALRSLLGSGLDA